MHNYYAPLRLKNSEQKRFILTRGSPWPGKQRVFFTKNHSDDLLRSEFSFPGRFWHGLCSGWKMAICGASPRGVQKYKAPGVRMQAHRAAPSRGSGQRAAVTFRVFAPNDAEEKCDDRTLPFALEPPGPGGRPREKGILSRPYNLYLLRI